MRKDCLQQKEPFLQAPVQSAQTVMKDFHEIANQEDFFYKHINFGNHLVVTYGDYIKELQLLGESLGLEVVTA